MSHYVYHLYASDGELLYVGRTSDVERRITWHTAIWSQSDPEIRERYAYHTAWRYGSEAEADYAERKAIWDENPKLNRWRPWREPVRAT